MEYRIEFKPKALKDLDSSQPDVARRVVERINRMRNNLAGDVKHLTNFTPEYRLRVGDWAHLNGTTKRSNVSGRCRGATFRSLQRARLSVAGEIEGGRRSCGEAA